MEEPVRVTHHELLQRLQDPWLSLVDVLPEESYAEAHIPGAISLPLRKIRENGRNVLRDLNREIVVYCSGPASNLSEEAVALLKELGYRNVRRFEGGLRGWKESGGALEQQAGAKAAGTGQKRRQIGLSPRLQLLERSSFVTLLFAWLGMVLLFGLIYELGRIIPGSGLKENGRLLGHSFHDFLTAMYFSFVTATSVGFGDVVPVGSLRLLAIMESGLALLLFGVIVTKLVNNRQEDLLEEIHQIAFEDRLSRVRTNLHFVLMELQQIEGESRHKAFAPERVMPRLESAIMVFVGELKSIHDLLQGPHETTLDTTIESMLAGLAANLRQLRDLLDRDSENSDSTDSFAALAFNAILSPHLKSIRKLATEICRECASRQPTQALKYWLDEIQSLAQF